MSVGEWCCEVVGSCMVQQVVKCSFLLPRNLIKLVCVHYVWKNAATLFFAITLPNPNRSSKCSNACKLW